MRAAGRVVREALERCTQACRSGASTMDIDRAAVEVFEAHGAKALFKNYPTYRPGEGFPGHVCVSINEEVVHGIPSSKRTIKEGDIVSIDCGAQIDGWCSDAAVTVAVGEVDPRTTELCRVTEHMLRIAVENIRPGRKWSQIARLMENYARQAGFGVVQEYVGHGIGRKLHEEPKVPNFVSPDLVRHDIDLRPGMVLAVEPMCNRGSREVAELDDGWTVVTVDREPSAHYEHTIAVTAGGADVLTDGR